VIQYEPKLGPISSANVAKRVTRKVKWSFKKADVDQLRAYLSLHLAAINAHPGTIAIQLAEQGLSTIDLISTELGAKLDATQASVDHASNNMNIKHNSLIILIDKSNQLVRGIATDVSSQTSFIETNHETSKLSGDKQKSYLKGLLQYANNDR
jgi:hypothetical protein